MRVLFIYGGAENLGIEYMSSFLQSKRHQVELLFDPAAFSGDILFNNRFLASIFSVDKTIVKKAVDMKPDLIGFSAYTGNYRWCLRIARGIKEHSDVPIVFGGVHTTAVPQRVLQNGFIDYAIVGEGEYALLDLMENLHKGPEGLVNIPNLCFNYKGSAHINSPRPYITDLNVLPFPDKAIFYDKVPLLEDNYLITTSRGCSYNCTYCSNNMYHSLYDNEKKHIRRRSPDNVIEELKGVKKRARAKLINFGDDVFTSSKSWLEEFIEKYSAAIDMPFFCSVHHLTINRDIAHLLKQGHCWLVTMGVQSGSERIRSEIFNRKGSNQQIIDAVASIKEMGIKISVDNIFGAPTETESDLEQGLALYKQIKADRILTFWLTYYPRTRIIDTACQQGMLEKNDVQRIEEGYSGFTHGGGSVDSNQKSMYLKYQLLFHLRSLIHNEKLYSALSKFVVHLPCKGLLAMFLVFLNAVKNKDVKFFFFIRYYFCAKNTP